MEKKKKKKKVSKIEKKKESKKKKLLNALEDSLGIVTLACKSAGISRGIYYKYINSDESFKKAAEEISEVALDLAEHSLLTQIKAGETTATIFYLKTKGRKRGYVERIDNNVTINPFLELMKQATEEDS